jgi:hypothetical protein
MIGATIFNNNSGRANYAGSPQPVTGPGVYCAISAAYPNVITSASYVVVAGAGVTALTVGVQILEAFEPSATLIWQTASTPNSNTGAVFSLISATGAGVFNGSFTLTNGLFVPCHGIRLNITTLTGGQVTYAELLGTLG